MKTKSKGRLVTGAILTAAFIIWTVLVKTVDVQPVGVHRTEIGFAGINTWFHELTGVHLNIYDVTDTLSIAPLLVCVIFGLVGLVQLIRRRSLFKVDYDIIALGVYYIGVIVLFLAFEVIAVNYRPILIEGVMEASYPSSTTLLVLSVMPTLMFQARRRIGSKGVSGIICIITALFTAFMVIGRLISGVHWLTDIIGGVLLSLGLLWLYMGAVARSDEVSYELKGMAGSERDQRSNLEA